MITWLTWAVALLIAGLGSVVIVQLFGLGKTKTRKVWTWIGVALIVAGGLPALGITNYGYDPINNPIKFGDSTLAVGDSGTGGVGTTPSTGSGSVIAGGCIYDGLSPKISGKNIITGASTGGSNAYQVLKNGVVTVTTSVSDGASISADYGDVVKVLYGNESNTFGFFGKVKEFTLPCDKYPQLIENLYANGSITTEVFTNKGSWTKDGTANFTGIGTNDVKTTDLRMSGQTFKGIDTGFIVIIEYNNTAFDKFELRTSDDLSAYPTVATPTTYTSPASGRTAVAYDVNEPIIGSGYKNFKLLVDASANGPTTANPDAGVNMTFMPKAPYIDDNSGGNFAGPSVLDENNRRNYLYTPVTNLFFTS